MENNKVHSLPNNFSDLQHLVHLNFAKNCFEDIPNDISSLTGLKYCSFNGNKIMELNGDVLSKMFYVYKIDLQNNPIGNKEELLVSVYTRGRLAMALDPKQARHK